MGSTREARTAGSKEATAATIIIGPGELPRIEWGRRRGNSVEDAEGQASEDGGRSRGGKEGEENGAKAILGEGFAEMVFERRDVEDGAGRLDWWICWRTVSARAAGSVRVRTR